MHDVANITYSFLFLTDEHGCLMIVGLSDLHAFGKDYNGDLYRLFDAPKHSSHITHLVYMKPQEAYEALSQVLERTRTGTKGYTVIPAYLLADADQARRTGEAPPGWYKNDQRNETR